MRRRSLARLAAAAALATAACQSGPSAPASFRAEATRDFLRVHLAWSGGCGTRCELEARAGALLGTLQAPAGAEEALFELPDTVLEMTPIEFRIRNVASGDESEWVTAGYLAGLRPPDLRLSSQVSATQRTIELDWYPSPRAERLRLERVIVSPFGDPADAAPWEELPQIELDAPWYLEPRAAEWVDLAEFQYRLRSVAGDVESHPMFVTTPPGPPAAPWPVAARVDGGNILLSWTNRSRAATSIELQRADRYWAPIASLPPTASSYVDPGRSPGFHWYSVEALAEGVGTAPFSGSGAVIAGALVPDPALDAEFTQETVALAWAESVARLPDGTWALGAGISAWANEVARVWAPEGAGWAAYESPPNRVLARTGPVVDAAGRVHAFVGPGAAPPDLSTGPIVHVWREGGAWHEEQIGYAVSLLWRQLWAAAAPDGSLHVVWRSEPGVPVASYAVSRGGTWTVEEIPGAALADQDVGWPLAVTPAGEPAVLLPSPPGGATAYTLHRRTDAGWTAEAVPDEPGATVAGTLAVLAPSADRAVWLQDCGPLPSYETRTDVCLRERTSAGWGTGAVVATGTWAIPPSIAAVDASGSRVAITVGAAPDPVQLLVYGAGVSRTWSFAGAPWLSALGFDPGGKVWLLCGVGFARSYALYQER